MRHTKLEGLMTPIERLGRVSAATYDAATRPRTAPSGTISYDNADGTRTIIGPQAGSATMATHVGDVTPPGRPLGVAGASSAGVVYVAWGGELEGGTPADFDHVSLYMSVEGVSELVGTLTEAGIVSTVPMATTATVEVWATAEDDACLADGTPAHNVSEESDHATVAVTQGEDAAAVDALRDRMSKVEATANAANSTAGTAKATATAAQAKADDAWARTLRVEVMSAPADAAGDTSLLTAYAFRGGELLSDEAVAKMGLLAWYVGGSRVATGSTYTCAAGTATECRLEA